MHQHDAPHREESAARCSSRSAICSVTTTAQVMTNAVSLRTGPTPSGCRSTTCKMTVAEWRTRFRRQRVRPFGAFARKQRHAKNGERRRGERDDKWSYFSCNKPAGHKATIRVIAAPDYQRRRNPCRCASFSLICVIVRGWERPKPLLCYFGIACLWGDDSNQCRPEKIKEKLGVPADNITSRRLTKTEETEFARLQRVKTGLNLSKLEVGLTEGSIRGATALRD